jgi:peptidoglycan/LPS O-acetylase OafA/YrhL
MNSIYFAGLNGLRFIAAFLVLVTHSESIRAKLGFFNISAWSISKNGGLAVQFFFVLSGFLITYLLFQENRHTNTISIKDFYLRRIYRIWPLYYAIALFGLFVLPYFILPLIHQPFHPEYDLFTASACILLLFPNLANSFFETNHLHSLWSIGVEEQFYLVWAPLVKYFKQHFKAICYTVIVIKIALLSALQHWMPDTWQTYFVATLQFECMAIGGLGAYWLFHEGKVEGNVWFSRAVQSVVLFLIGTLIFANLELSANTAWWAQIWQFFFKTPIYAILSNILFVYLIINISKNPLRLINTDNRIFDFLGEISYGLYMFHPLIVHIVIKAFAKKLLFLPNWGFLIAMYSLTLLVLIAISYASFRFFEKPIINMNKKRTT